MTIRPTFLATVLALALGGTAQAGVLRPIEALSIDLGNVSGVAYYTVEKKGFRVVATLGKDGAATPVRVEAVLAPGQSVVLAVPHAAGAAPEALQISRQGDEVRVHKPLTN